MNLIIYFNFLKFFSVKWITYNQTRNRNNSSYKITHFNQISQIKNINLDFKNIKIFY